MEAPNKPSFTFVQNLVVILLVANLTARTGSATSTNEPVEHLFKNRLGVNYL